MLEWDFDEAVSQSNIQIFDCDQGTPEWFECRLGIPTASMFKSVMAGGNGDTRYKYMLKLLGERMTGKLQEGFSTTHTERGKIMEDDARNAYAFMKDVEPESVGFIRNGDKGASPDSLIDDNGLLEIKTKLPELQLDVLIKDVMPNEHKAQVQGQIWVAEREWCDFVSYWPGLPLFVHRVYRDDAYIELMSGRIDKFLNEINDLHEKISNKYL